MGNYPGWENYAGPTTAKPKRSKYRAERTEVNGITFASRREASRYEALLLEQRAGAISGLELQPRFPLHVLDPRGVKLCIGQYTADFRYARDSQIVIEDAKGMRTESYSLRKRHVEAEYGIRILET